MKLSDIKQDIDNYFDSVSSENIVNQFKELGYEFQSLDDQKLLDKIDEWHDSDSKLSLHEYLGLTREKYRTLILK